MGTHAFLQAWSRSRPLRILPQQWFTSLGWARLLWLHSWKNPDSLILHFLHVDLHSGFTLEQANWIPRGETHAFCQGSGGKGNQAGLHPQKVAGMSPLLYSNQNTRRKGLRMHFLGSYIKFISVFQLEHRLPMWWPVGNHSSPKTSHCSFHSSFYSISLYKSL